MEHGYALVRGADGVFVRSAEALSPDRRSHWSSRAGKPARRSTPSDPENAMPPRKTAAAPTGAEPPLDFEESMKRLETVVDELESGELSLEDSIARYEEGVKLSRRLTQTLDAAEKRIERLVESGDDAEPTTEAVELKLGNDDGPEGELPF